jgi:hypothetical protein
MKSTLVRGLVVSGAAFLAATAFSPIVSAQAATTSSTTYQVNLTQQNKSGASGTATITVSGSNVLVSIRGNGFSPNVAHAAHLHIGGQNACPATTADTNKDGYVDTKEAIPSIGTLKVSLTTSGDTSANSALATDRAPKADAKGALSYNRSFTLPSGVKPADLAKSTLDVHGITSLFNDKTKYDGDKKSELDSKVNFETTVPAACGVLTTSPTGGAATGVGSISGIESPSLFIAGAAAILGAAGAAIIARKQLSSNNR